MLVNILTATELYILKCLNGEFCHGNFAIKIIAWAQQYAKFLYLSYALWCVFLRKCQYEQNDLVHCFNWICLQIYNVGNVERSLVFEFCLSFIQICLFSWKGNNSTYLFLAKSLAYLTWRFLFKCMSFFIFVKVFYPF